MGEKEEITDIINALKDRYTTEHFAAMQIKKGKVLRFDYEGSPVTLKITRVAKGRYWAEHVELIDQRIVRTHNRHNIDAAVNPPFCIDCEVPVDEPSNEDGEKKYQDRVDTHLTDGTPI